MTNTGVTRRRELIQVAASLVVVLAATAVVSQMLVEAWDDYGLVYHLVHGLVNLLGVHIRAFVVFVTTVLVTWVGLFALDDHKHVQGALLIAALLFVFLPALFIMGRWYGNIDFFSYPIAAILGVLVGATIASINANVPPLQGGGRYAFPMAGLALYTTVSVTVIVGLIERHLTYQNPVRTVATTQTAGEAAAGPLTLVIDILAVWAIVYLLGYFVRYSDVTNVVISSPSEGAVATFLGNLYERANSKYGATTVEGGHILNWARSAEGSQPQIDSRVAFQFQSGGPFSRRREVSYENIRPISSNDLEPLRRTAEDRQNRWQRIWSAFKQQLLLSAPPPIRSALRRSGGPHLDRIVRADVLILLAPVSDVVESEPDDLALEDRLKDREYLQVYDDICDICSRGTMPTVYVVGNDASVALPFHRDDDLSTEQFVRFLRKDVFRLGRSCRVIPVGGADDGATYDELLASL